MRVKTTVAQVSMQGGDRYDRPSGILVEEHTPRLAKGRDRGSLYVLVEVLGQTASRAIVANQLAEVIGTAYYGWQGSVTAGLQNAIREANNLLFAENRNSLPGEKQTAGVSCMVLRTSSRRSPSAEQDMFIAQAGPAAIYHAHEGQVTRFPEISPWLDGLPLEDMDAAALGERRDLNVALYHTQVSTNDTVLLVESGPASKIPSQQWPHILNRDSTEAVLDALVEAGKGHELSALVVRLDDEGSEQPAAHPSGPGSPRDLPRPTVPSIVEQASTWFNELQLRERLRVVGRAFATALGSIWGVLLTGIRRMVPGPQQARGRQTTTVKESKKMPKQRKKERAPARAPSDRVQKLLIGAAVAIPLIVAAIVLVAYLQRGQVRQEELDTLWQEANNRWGQALQLTDQAETRTLLMEAEDYLDQLLKLRPEHAEAADLRKRVEVWLDGLNQVQRLSWIGDLGTYPESANLTRVVVEGVNVFVMDRQASKVYHHQLDEFQQALQPDSMDVVLVSKGDPIGNVSVGDLVDMVWMPKGTNRQTAKLVILESGGALLEYDPATGELTALKVATTETWQYPKLIGSYYGRFYLLDPNTNKIWRYQPTLDGYSEAPDDWLQAEVDLAGVEDMAIGDSIYLLYADGRILKLTAGSPAAFDISDWDTAPLNPTAFFTRPPEDTEWVYVADRGNSRIVQCSKEGQFQRQFRLADAQTTEGGDPLAGVTSLFVDEIGGRAYFLSGQKLFVIILPD